MALPQITTPVGPASTSQHADIHRWAAAYERLHIDLGTGDGKYAVHLARQDPGTGVVALDTNLDHLRGARRRYPDNLRFLAGDALSWPLGMLPAAGAATVNFPYGSLLRGLVAGDAGLLARLDALLAPGARLEVRVNRSALDATGLDPDAGPATIAAALRQIDGLRVGLRRMERSELRSFPSSWSKRLGFGRETSAYLISATRSALR